MFKIFLGFFLAFTLVYALFTSALIYHIKEYSLPGKPLPKLILTVFIFLSGLSWLFALYFLLKIPS